MKIIRVASQPLPPLTLFLYLADVDECSLNNPSHDCEQICINTNGGFKCSCTEQYVLANDSRSCEGILIMCIRLVCPNFSSVMLTLLRQHKGEMPPDDAGHM